jgi:hypothetical protein
MEWNGMEWNGMEWNGMEWNGIIERICKWIHSESFTRNTTNSSDTPPMRLLGGSYRGFFFSSCSLLWREHTAKSGARH